MSEAVPKTQGFITLRSVVMSVLNRVKDYTMRDYTNLMQLAIEGFTELNLWHMDSVEVEYMHYHKHLKACSLPFDFVDWLKVGIPVNGRIKVLTRDDSILLPRNNNFQNQQYGNLDAKAKKGSPVYFADHVRCGQFVGGLFGYSGGISNESYRFDRERMQFVFTGEITGNDIVLEYISSGVRLDGATSVPREAAPALRAYILWNMVEHDPRVSLNEKARREDNYDKAVSMLRDFQSTFTKEEYMRMVYSTMRQTPKR